MDKEKKIRKVAEKVTDKRIVDGKTYYYVVWKGASQEAGTWMLSAKLAKIHRLIRQFQGKLKMKRRRQFQRKIQIINQKQQSQKNIVQPSSLPLKQQDLPNNSIPPFLVPQHCVSLLSDSQEQKQQDRVQEESIKISRFDCIKGLWTNVTYKDEEIKKIDELRRTFAWKHQKENVGIKKVIRVNGHLIVQYERNGRNYQCLLQTFKTYMPQLLIKFLLKQYDPAYNQVRLDNTATNQHAFSDSQ